MDNQFSSTGDNKLLDLSQGPNPQVYEISDYLISGNCYCVVVHFANGKTVRSQVMYR